MIAMPIWLVAWLIAGAPDAQPWTPWFVFLVACSVWAVAHGISQIGGVTNIINTPAAQPQNDDE